MTRSGTPFASSNVAHRAANHAAGASPGQPAAGPPHLVVGRGQHAAQLGPGNGAPQRDVDMGSQAPLGLDGGKILDLCAEVTAQVLNKPVEQRGERQRVPRRLVIGIPGRVDGHAAVVDPTVRRAGQRDEQRGAERRAVRRGVRLPQGARADLLLGRSGASWRRRVDRCRRAGRPGATFPRTPDLVISSSSSRMSSSKSSVSCPAALAWSRDCWASARIVIHHCWSSIAASGVRSGSSSSCHPSRHCTARRVLARSAQDGQAWARVCPQGNEHLVHLAGVEVGAAELDRTDAGSVLDGQVFDHLAG